MSIGPAKYSQFMRQGNGCWGISYTSLFILYVFEKLRNAKNNQLSLLAGLN
jgi:hypothetical protein